MAGMLAEPSTQLTPVGATSIDRSWRGVYRVGGVCLLLLGLLYLSEPTFARALNVAPADSEAYLANLAAHPTPARILYGLFCLIDFLTLPAALALYLALQRVARNAMLLAAALLVVSALLDVTLTEMNQLTLVTLTQHAAAATSDAQRVAYTAAADYARATIPLATFYSYVLGALGILIAAWVMRKSVFSRWTAHAGIGGGMMLVLAGFYVIVPALSILLTPGFLLAGLWALSAGVRLYRLNGREQEPVS
jgi:hypothetical protein